MHIFISILLIFSITLYASQKDTVDDFESEFSQEEEQVIHDSLYEYNKAMTEFNDILITKALTPISKGYSFIIPKPIRLGVENIFDNLLFPIRFLNNLLQLKIENCFEESERFVINSTIGIVGFFDIANDSFHIKRHEEDFGQTLGFYGFKSGVPIVWPFFGQSNIRDSIGLVVDTITNPLNYMENRGYNLLDSNEEYFLIKSLDIINYTSLHVKEYEELKKDAIELYPFIRDVYEQRRDRLIKE